MKIGRKNINLITVLGLSVAAGVLFAVFTGKKKPEPIPEPEQPEQPEPAPKPTPGTTQASAVKIAELQNLMIKRFEQLNRPTEYNASAARGGWGNLSATALKTLQPANYAAKGNPNAQNIDFWINAIKKDVETAAKEIQTQQQKKKSEADLIKLAEQYAAHFNAGKSLQIAADFTAVEHVFDNVKRSWIPTANTRKFFKGNKFKKTGTYKRAQPRGNGQFFFVQDNKFFPTSPSNLIAI